MKYVIKEKQLKDFSNIVRDLLESFFSDNEYVCNFEVSFDEEQNVYIVAVVYDKEKIVMLNREKGNTSIIILNNQTKREVLNYLHINFPFTIEYFSFAKECK